MRRHNGLLADGRLSRKSGTAAGDDIARDHAGPQIGTKNGCFIGVHMPATISANKGSSIRRRRSAQSRAGRPRGERERERERAANRSPARSRSRPFDPLLTAHCMYIEQLARARPYSSLTGRGPLCGRALCCGEQINRRIMQAAFPCYRACPHRARCPSGALLTRVPDSSLMHGWLSVRSCTSCCFH